MCFAGALHATGYFGPNVYLDDGGKNVDGSPEFYWDLEVRRLAKEFHPAEKLLVSEKQAPTPDTDERDTRGNQDTGDADLKDFDAALQEGRIKPPDAAKAKKAHAEARSAIDGPGSAGKPTPSASTAASVSATPRKTEPLSSEFDSEFADYHKGADAYSNEGWDDARTAWENLLKRPEQDRHYRTVWAAFMLGKVALKTKDFPAASTWFQKTREFTKAGFADSLGLAAESYGWEGRAEWKQDHPEKAAALFLTQLALGDDSAVISLKALIPDREPVEGMLNYGPKSAEDFASWTDEQKREEDQKEMARLKVAAQDPLLRRLVTVHILATATSNEYFGDEEKTAAANRCKRWLDIIKQANINRVQDAEYLGWAAYNNGDYKGAAHWLELSKGDSAAAIWLRAKLERRAGKLQEASTSMAKAVELLRTSPAYASSNNESEVDEDYQGGGHWSFENSANGDLGGLQLVRGDFVQAFDVLFKGRLWEDAAFVAERVLTTNELKQYVDALPAEEPKEVAGNNDKLRYLLGRRLVREDHYVEAAPYLRKPYDKVLEKYVKALQDGANEKLQKTDRARAWFTAAWIARHDGMELMGTEVAPDSFAESGAFEIPDLAKQRRAGVYQKISYDKQGNEQKKNMPAVLKASPKEIQRLNANKIEPDIRFHYRLIAGALAMKAGALLPDNSEELADVINQAGVWVKDRDEKTGNRYYQVIDHRCAKTKIGQTDRTKHWFVDQEGPWSTAEQQSYKAFHKELKLDVGDDTSDQSSTPAPTP